MKVILTGEEYQKLLDEAKRGSEAQVDALAKVEREKLFEALLSFMRIKLTPHVLHRDTGYETVPLNELRNVIGLAREKFIKNPTPTP